MIRPRGNPITLARGRENEARLLAFLAAFRAEHGRSPALREVAAALGWRSTCSVDRVLTRLAAQGRIVRPKYRRGAVEVVAP